jgi:hypothetical protein
MDLAKRDKIILLLQSEVDNTQDTIMEYLRDAENVQKDNEFLESVTNDYKRYHEYILQQKKEQREHIEMLSSYLDKNLDQANMSLEMAKRVRWQQNQILGELEKVKTELDKITLSK